MKNVLRSKKWTAAAIGVMFFMLAILVVLSVHCYKRIDTISEYTAFLDGEYSIDGGEWKPIDNTRSIEDNFQTIVFKGRFIPAALSDKKMVTISSKNVWYTLKTSDGKVQLEYQPRTVDDDYREYLLTAEKDDPMRDRDYFEKHYYYKTPFYAYTSQTPGYSVEELDAARLLRLGYSKKDEVMLEVTNPYHLRSSFSDCFEILISYPQGSYLQFFYNAMPTMLLSLLVCFFGIFFFPIAGFILGKTDYKYFTFGSMCFFWGLSMMSKSVSGYLNLWILDPTICMLVDVTIHYLFVISVLFYLKSNLERSVTRAIANIIGTVFILIVIAALALHFTNVIDFYASTGYMIMFTSLSVIIMAVLLFIEAHNNRRAIFILASWTPLTVCLIVDSVNSLLHFSALDFYLFGLAVTMVYQIVRLVLDLKRQYKEAIRYQTMQKELYEAKVAVMVSQIQPHFLYNSLSSIAMLCKLDPDTAQKATIAFTKYLRGNMDSLRQTAPVPFERELDHLEKYLYIEKLRFGNKLNIVYDIQTTDFDIPLLSVQPLVENAVKHGVGMKEDGGTVTIATHETDEHYEVIISDDGVGFDTSAQKNDGRSHIGMENTRKRLKDMCNAEVVITSKPGEGTVAKIIIPKEELQ